MRIQNASTELALYMLCNILLYANTVITLQSAMSMSHLQKYFTIKNMLQLCRFYSVQLCCFYYFDVLMIWHRGKHIILQYPNLIALCQRQWMGYYVRYNNNTCMYHTSSCTEHKAGIVYNSTPNRVDHTKL